MKLLQKIDPLYALTIATVLALLVMLCGVVWPAEKIQFEIYQSVNNGRVAVCHINLVPNDYQALQNFSVLYGNNYLNSFNDEQELPYGYIKYETENHIIQKEDRISCCISFTEDPQPKAEYYYSKIGSELYISLPWNNLRYQYDIPLTALNVKYDRSFKFKVIKGIRHIYGKTPCHIAYDRDSDTVNVWTYTKKGSRRLRLYQMIPVLRTDIDKVEFINGEIHVPCSH